MNRRWGFVGWYLSLPMRLRLWLVLFVPGFILLMAGFLVHSPTVDHTGQYLEAASGVVMLIALVRSGSQQSRRTN